MTGRGQRAKLRTEHKMGPSTKTIRTGKVHMRSSYGKSVLPAAIAAAFFMTASGTVAVAADFGQHGAYRHHQKGSFFHRGSFHRTHGKSRHGSYHGLRFLPTLPVLIEPQPSSGGTATAVSVPGIPAPVPQATAGPMLADVQGTYLLRSYYDGYGLPTALPGVGTYVGGIQAVADYENGNYFAVDGSLDLAAPGSAMRPMAKVIEVKPGEQNANCDMQHGVCIIRP